MLNLAPDLLCLSLSPTFVPVGHGVQEELGCFGYQTGGGGQGCQLRLRGGALGNTLSCESLQCNGFIYQALVASTYIGVKKETMPNKAVPTKSLGPR